MQRLVLELVHECAGARVEDKRRPRAVQG
jgi:hypothetical protein